jgi:hypothetical protein
MMYLSLFAYAKTLGKNCSTATRGRTCDMMINLSPFAHAKALVEN